MQHRAVAKTLVNPPREQVDASRLDLATSPDAPKTTSNSTILVGLRVDALVIAFAIENEPSFHDELIERQSFADESGTAQLVVASLSFAMTRSRRRDEVCFENADLHGKFDERAAGGWQLELVLRATYLATHDLGNAIALVRRVAAGFGTIKGTRLRRFDLAADFTGFPLAHNDIERIVTQRARIATFLPESKDVAEAHSGFDKPNVVEHLRSDHVVTGYSIAQGNPLMARIYDKTEELSLSGREEKRAIENAIWSKNGWNGVDRVTRVEFQHRGNYLDEIDLRDVDRLIDSLDAVWQRDVRWLRLVVPDSASRRTRCKLDTRWQAVTRTVFRHVTEPVERHRRSRGGATPEHVLGATRSRLAAAGQLVPIELGYSEDGELLNERTFANRMTTDEAHAWLEQHVGTTFKRAAIDAVKTLRNGIDPRDAVARFITKHNSTVARFSSVDDELPVAP